MDIEDSFELMRIGIGLGLLLAIVAIPLAYRRGRRSLWYVHACRALSLGIGIAITSHVVVFHYVIPWWQTGVGLLAGITMPALVTAWVAHTTARRWPTQSRWRIGAAGLAALLVSFRAGMWVGSVTLPDLVNAIK